MFLVNILKYLALLVLVVHPAGCAIADLSGTTGDSAAELARLEMEVHQRVNRYRLSRGLPTLIVNEVIAEEARRHSQAMARKRVPFGHKGFPGRAKRISDSLPLRAVAENVGYSQGLSDPGKRAVEAWLESTEHRRNMEGDFQLTGIGVARDSGGAYYFTQIYWQ
jgi:uncharacterized protein YkwD